MINVLQFIFGWIRVTVKLQRPSGVKAIAAENMVLRQQLLSLSRHHKRSPKLTGSERIIYGLLGGLINQHRLSKISILIKPATIIKFHKALVKRKYQALFSNKSSKKPGKKGPSEKLVELILQMKQRNPSYGYLRIAMQIEIAFGIKIEKDVVRRVLNKHYKHNPNGDGPSWLTFIGHMKDSLWSVDLFKCESIHLKTHWVMVVIEQFSREIIGFAVRSQSLTGIDVCCMFNQIKTNKPLPKYLSSDHDPLFKFHRWQANLRIIDVEEIKTVPYAPMSHPFIERVIGTIRRECLDKTLFWNERDLMRKLDGFKDYYNKNRGHSSLNSM